jgi:phosphatidate cytidylyltransferase
MAADLSRRARTAALVLPGLLLAVTWGPPWLFLAILAAALGLAGVELGRLLQDGGVRPQWLLGGGVAGALVWDLTSLASPGATPLVVAALLCLGIWSGRADPAAWIRGAGASLAAGLYLGVTGGALARLRAAPPEEDGGSRILLLLAVVMVSDTAAYFAGHAFGRRPLAPLISPAKTVEGALGGLAGGAVAGAGAALLAFPAHGIWQLALLGAVAAGFGALGDLAESALKRWAGAKDSGRLLPGHGGMLDRLDSLLSAAPVLYYYFAGFR